MALPHTHRTSSSVSLGLTTCSQVVCLRLWNESVNLEEEGDLSRQVGET